MVLTVSESIVGTCIRHKKRFFGGKVFCVDQKNTGDSGVALGNATTGYEKTFTFSHYVVYLLMFPEEPETIFATDDSSITKEKRSPLGSVRSSTIL